MTLPARLVVDTDVVIHLLRKRADTVAIFLALVGSGAQVLVSSIVIAEVYAGAFEREHKDIETFFGLCTVVDVTAATARLAGGYAQRFKKSHTGISLEDHLLAATAREHRSPLWTGNRKHYPMDDIELWDAPPG